MLSQQRRVTKQQSTEPSKQSTNNKGEQRCKEGDKINIPYPPNFRRTPDKSIEPNRGASVWALGSQACNQNSGDLTPKVRNKQYTTGREESSERADTEEKLLRANSKKGKEPIMV